MIIVIHSFFDTEGFQAPSVVGTFESLESFLASRDVESYKEFYDDNSVMIESCWNDETGGYDKDVEEMGHYYLIHTL